MSYRNVNSITRSNRLPAVVSPVARVILVSFAVLHDYPNIRLWFGKVKRFYVLF